MEESQKEVRIEYIPPASDRVDAFSQQVCTGLGDEFMQPEIVHGFTQFVTVVIRIATRHLNSKVFDNERQ